MIQNTQKETYIIIRIHKYYNQCTYCTKLYRSIQNTQPYVQWYNIEKKNMKKCDKTNSHISNKSYMNNIASNNDRHPVTKTFTPQHYTCLHLTSTQLKLT